jgi:phospholipase C
MQQRPCLIGLTLRDWIGISSMLGSARVAAAPTLGQLLTLPAPRADLPIIAAPTASLAATSLAAAPNDLQRSLVSGAARRYGLDPASALTQIQTRQHAVDFLKRRSSTFQSL